MSTDKISLLGTTLNITLPNGNAHAIEYVALADIIQRDADRKAAPTPSGMSFSPEGCLVIQEGDRAWKFTRDYIIDLQRGAEAAAEAVSDAEYRLNGTFPDRFLPIVLKDLETRAGSVGAPRDEAYAMAALMIRSFLREKKS